MNPLTPCIIGIDPGLSGGVAVLDRSGELVTVADLPFVHDKSLAWVDGGDLQVVLLNALKGRPARAYVERVSAMPGQGVASSFQFGCGLGSILSVLQAMLISMALVTPAVWKRSYGLGKDKRASLDKARLMWPRADLRLIKHEGRAEALLIAEYGRRHMAGVEVVKISMGDAA
jgi:crossover junction endodeoxyribonuclease RuvC